MARVPRAMYIISWVTRQSGPDQFGVPSSHCIAIPTEITLKLHRLPQSFNHLIVIASLSRETSERTLNLALILDGLARIAILAWDPDFTCLGLFGDVFCQAGYAWNGFCYIHIYIYMTPHPRNNYISLPYVTDMLPIWYAKCKLDATWHHETRRDVFRWPLLISHLLFLQVFW